MKKLFSKTWGKIAFFAALALILFFATTITVTLIQSAQRETEFDIDHCVHYIFEYPDVADLDYVADEFASIRKSEKNLEEFESRGIKEIRKFDRSLTFFAYDINAQQIMLERLDYKSPAIKAAQEQMIRDALDASISTMDIDDLVYDILKEPTTEDKIYDIQLSYYVPPRTILIEEFLPQYFADKTAKAFASGNTGELLSLCNDLALVAEFDVIAMDDVLSIQDALTALTSGAEEIIVRPDSGGYYDGYTADSDSDFENDPLFDSVVNDLLGLEGESTHSTVETVEYFGDLASCFYTQTFHYEGTDQNGETHSTTQDKNTRRTVLLKGERINSSYTVNKKHIKYAYEDGMVSYHKDGYCFAISDNALTCFLGKYIFLLEF